MNKIFSTLLTTAVTLTLFSGISFANEAKSTNASHWGYTGHGSPESWGELSPKYHSCSQGKNQSPVDIRSSMDTSLEALKFTYTKTSKEILNNGHTVQVNMEAGDTMVVDGITFELKQFHFHTPSENHIDRR